MDKTKMMELLKEKGVSGDVLKMMDSMEEAGPWATITFAQLLENKQAHEVSHKVHELSEMFMGLVFNVIYNDMVENKADAVKALADEYTALVDEVTTSSKQSSLMDLLKELNPFKKVKLEAKQLKGDNQFLVKETDQGLRWLAIHTNKYQDSDNPPEIIASYAHQEFVEAVEKGLADYPDLWVWHTKEKSCVGKCDFLHYDEETGFLVSSGTFLPGKEHVAKGLAQYPYPLRVSHGMPPETIIRAVNDPLTIVRYRTREISPLPLGAEANKLTAFAIK